MEVEEAIKKRRMHRSFGQDPVDEGSLARLVWAATRAPMGGNELVRRIVLVTDPAVVRTVREVTPSFLANAPAIILICTDLERAEISMGVQGREVLSLLDAGAAAENVALTAVALGLGVCFVRSANDVALRAVLDLPETVRPDILIGIGRPAATPSPAMRHPAPVVYLNRFGSDWNVPPRPAHPAGGADGGADDDALFTIALYLVASARDCLDEPLIYGPFRMIEGVSRLIGGGAGRAGTGGEAFLDRIGATIEKEKYNVMADRGAFARWLDDLLRQFAVEARRRSLADASDSIVAGPRVERAAPVVPGEAT